MESFYKASTFTTDVIDGIEDGKSLQVIVEFELDESGNLAKERNGQPRMLINLPRVIDKPLL